MVSSFKALTIQSGVTTQIGNSQTLLVGTGIDGYTGQALLIGASQSNAVTITPPTTVNNNVTVNGSGTAFTVTGGSSSFQGNVTIADTSILTLSGSVATTSNGAASVDFSQFGGAFNTSTGTNTLNGNVVVAGSNTFATTSGLATLGGGLTVSGGSTTFETNVAYSGVAVTASAASSFDLSGASGAFKTTTGAVTVGPGAVTVSGVTTFTASGTALTVNNAATVSGALTAGSVLTSTVDTAAAGALAIGPTNATSVVVTPPATFSGDAVFNGTGTSLTTLHDGYIGGNFTVNGLGLGIAHISATGAFTSSAVNLASGDVTGVLPTANQAAQTMGGDVSGTTAAATVVALQGNAVQAVTLGASQDGYVATWVEAGPSIQFKPITATTSVTLSGDVTGLSSANTVAKINGTSVPATPSAAQILIAQSGTASLWETISQDATLAIGGALTVVSSHGNFAVGGNLTVTSGTSTLNGNLTVTTGGASVTGGLATDTINTSGLATLNSASVTTTLGVTGVSTLTGGALTNSVDAISGVALTIGGTNASTVQLGKVGSLTEVLGNFKVDGTETIIGASTFQNPVTFDGDVTIPDGYVLHTDSITSVGAGGSGAMTINGQAGLNLQFGGSNSLVFGSGTIQVQSGVTLSAAAGGTIVATTATSATTLNAPFTTTGVATGAAVYVSANDTVLAADNASLSTAYCAGFVTATGSVALDGLVTPIITGGTATAGQVMYLDTGANAGQVTATAPSVGVAAPVGIMKNATQMVIRVLSPVQL